MYCTLPALKALECWPRQLDATTLDTEALWRRNISARLSALLKQVDGDGLAAEQLSELEEVACALSVLLARLRAISDPVERVVTPGIRPYAWCQS